MKDKTLSIIVITQLTSCLAWVIVLFVRSCIVEPYDLFPHWFGVWGCVEAASVFTFIGWIILEMIKDVLKK